MKAVMLSIRPKYVEKILNGEKTFEIRKNRLPLNTTVYVFCTLRGMYELFKQIGHKYLKDKWYDKKGKVVAKIEFDKIEEIECDNDNSYENEFLYIHDNLRLLLYNACINEDELGAYGKGKTLYFHHISKVEIIEPKEIGEFYKPYNPKNKSDNFCSFEEYKERLKDGNLEVSAKLTKAPQSYCYVEVSNNV